MDCSERPVSEAVATNLRGCAAEARRVLGLGGAATPAEAVAAVDGFVHRWQRGDRPRADGVDPRDVPYLLGSLWGEAVVAAFGWAWAEVVFRRHDDTPATAVVSPDRSLAIFPIHHLLGLADDPTADCTVAAAFAEVAAGRPDGLTPGGFANLMDHVYPVPARPPSGSTP